MDKETNDKIMRTIQEETPKIMQNFEKYINKEHNTCDIKTEFMIDLRLTIIKCCCEAMLKNDCEFRSEFNKHLDDLIKSAVECVTIIKK